MQFVLLLYLPWSRSVWRNWEKLLTVTRGQGISAIRCLLHWVLHRDDAFTWMNNGALMVLLFSDMLCISRHPGNPSWYEHIVSEHVDTVRDIHFRRTPSPNYLQKISRYFKQLPCLALAWSACNMHQPGIWPPAPATSLLHPNPGFRSRSRPRRPPSCPKELWRQRCLESV